MRVKICAPSPPDMPDPGLPENSERSRCFAYFGSKGRTKIPELKWRRLGAARFIRACTLRPSSVLGSVLQKVAGHCQSYKAYAKRWPRVGAGRARARVSAPHASFKLEGS